MAKLYSSSNSSLALVAELVRWYLPVHSLVQFKLVSKEWRAWCSANLLQIVHKRWEDESQDWYFPLTCEFLQRNESSLAMPWYGLHHGTEQQHTLPNLDFLPFSDYNLEATSGGLLVVRKFLQPGDSILIVCNPLSKKWRRLPPHPNCRYKMVSLRLSEGLNLYGLSGPGPIHTHLVVDEFSKEYKVFGLSRMCIDVYNSATNCWACSVYNKEAHHPISGPVAHCSAYANGCIYAMELVGTTASTWRYIIWIYVIESGEWLPNVRYITLENFTTMDSLEGRVHWKRPRDPMLVVCMGNLYAVGASCQCWYRRELEHFYVKAKFHIFKLTQEGRFLEAPKHVVVRSEMLCKGGVLGDWEECQYFSCATRSNMICIAWKNRHVLQYDVVSGLRRKFCISGSTRGYSISRGYNLAYTPSLKLQP